MKTTLLSTNLFLILFIGFFLVPDIGHAQDDDLVFGPRRERIEDMRTAFITRKLNLSRSEAAAFWPIYNEYHEAIRKINERSGLNLDEIPRLEALSDTEAEKLLDAFLKSREQAMKLRIEFLKDIGQILPARKVLLFLQAERQFNRELLRRVQK